MGLRLVGVDYPGIEGLDELGWLKEIIRACSDPALTITQNGAGASLSLPGATTAARGLVLGGDVALYRAAADVLALADSLDLLNNQLRNAQLGTDINPNGYGGFKSILLFAQDNVAAGQTSVYLKVPGTANGVDITMPFSGSIIGLSVASSENRTAGTATIEPTVAGVLTGLQVYLNVGSPNFGRTTAAKDAYPFSAGQNLGVKLTTSADWAPTTADIVVTLVIEH